MKGDAQLMDFSSNSFLIVTLAMFAIAVFAVVEGWIPIAVIFVLFGVGGLLVRHTVKKKKNPNGIKTKYCL